VEGPKAKQAIALEVKDLHFRYEKSKQSVDALNGVSFSCEAEKIHGILGPNGSGKSTTFKIISTLLRAQSGSVSVFGIDRDKQEKQLRQAIGVCFQSPSLDPILTVRENLWVQGTLLGLSSLTLSKEIERWLEKFSLTERSQDRVGTLSGGLARRVELIKSLLHKPKLLLLDEPTVGLDPTSREEFWKELRQLRDQGMSIVVTTHLMDEAELCDELLFMAHGKCVAGGTPSNLKQEFKKEYVYFKAEKQDSMMDSLKEVLNSGAQIDSHNGRVRIETKNPDEVIDLLRRDYRDQLESLEWDKATLGDIYRSKTGVSL